MKLYLSEEQHKDYFGDFIDTEKTKRIKDANEAYEKLEKLLYDEAYCGKFITSRYVDYQYGNARTVLLRKLRNLIPEIKKESYVTEKLTLHDFARLQENMRDLIRDILVAMYGVNKTETEKCVKVVNKFFDVINKDFYVTFNGYTDDEYEKGVHFTENDIKMMSKNSY